MKTLKYTLVTLVLILFASCSIASAPTGTGSTNGTGSTKKDFDIKVLPPDTTAEDAIDPEIAKMEQVTTTTSKDNIVKQGNPASINCMNSGGMVEIKKQPHG